MGPRPIAKRVFFNVRTGFLILRDSVDGLVEPFQLLFPLCCWLIHHHIMPVLLGLTLAYIGCTLQVYW